MLELENDFTPKWTVFQYRSQIIKMDESIVSNTSRIKDNAIVSCPQIEVR